MSAPMPAFRRLSAEEQLRLNREYPRLLPPLLRQGLAPEDAIALAWNAALLYKVLDPAPESPAAVLRAYSIGEIAALCDTYRRVAAGELEYGEAFE